MQERFVDFVHVREILLGQVMGCETKEIIFKQFQREIHSCPDKCIFYTIDIYSWVH